MATDVMKMGIVVASVCSNDPVEEMLCQVAIEAGVEVDVPRVSKDTHFATGQTNPCVCEKDPTRQHYLVEF